MWLFLSFDLQMAIDGIEPKLSTVRPAHHILFDFMRYGRNRIATAISLRSVARVCESFIAVTPNAMMMLQQQQQPIPSTHRDFD